MRIITGTAKGCRLKAPKGMSTRPTSDRIKESLFSILGSLVLDASVLDLFAGTGGLGLEALSRGASHAVFVDASTADIIRENAEHARLLGNSEIVHREAISFLGHLAGGERRFDLIFCDPPYHKGLWEKALVMVDRGDLLLPGGVLVVEHGGDERRLPDLRALECVREVSYGHTSAIRMFRKKEALKEAETP